MSGITKTFPGVRALDGVDLEVEAGEVHCLLGQNGAGKSTLIKVLSGAHQPDAGTIGWQGRTVRLTTPVTAMRLGIATIYQELDLVEHLSVAENVYLGHEIARHGFLRTGEARTRAAALLARLGHPEIPPETLVGDLPAAGQQIVSMARALSHDVRLIVMDEPSAALDPDEVDNLFRIVGDLTAEGVAVVYISHRLEEIRRIGDRVSVLKDGRVVAGGLSARTTGTREVVSLMTGRDIEYAFPERAAAPGTAGAGPVLRTEGLTRAGEFAPLDLDVHPGEIVGLAGLVGSGRSEILETVYGARRPTAGRVLVDGAPLRPGSVPAAVRAGIGLAPEERKAQALLMLESVTRNVSVSSLARFATGGWLDRTRERAAAHGGTRDLSLSPDDPDRPVRTLSGGNQQKVVLARWLLRECRVLLLDEPTRGVDVGARSELYALIHRLADEGVAVLLVSSEVPEVLGLADRVLVLREGEVVHTAPARELDEHRVLDLVMEGTPSC
ncbi:sugar ABC transporter ATP-binding protein [Streptomyces sp. JJ36]|uniref:sugar ABC transporter ATP-binding protein n=1 Tax=Streptomyces sp. JJ36 TaxID=2736645 RepID=UPI001F2DBB05|nr:sugar ABC transporter ATP-binding protein [Streptomyces sp. JJ36]MCF6525919.1 sugar ABC transporter ATP-binding protein [Streptomyces sp. JJ36]